MLGIFETSKRVDHTTRSYRVVDDAGAEHRAQQPVYHVIETSHWNPSGRDRLLECPTKVLIAGHLHVETCHYRVVRGVRAVPIGDYEAGKMPGAFKHMVQQPIILARPMSHHLVIAAHNGGRLSDAYAELKGQ